MKKLPPALLSLTLIPAYLMVSGTLEQPGSARQQQLRQTVAQNCTVCHGKSLQGDVGPALTAKSLAGKNEEMLVATILEGRDGTIMPSWAWMIKENEARWLVRVLRGDKK